MNDSSISGVEPAEEVDEADALEQAQPVTEEERLVSPDTGIEVPEADAYEQAIEVPFDEEDVR